MILLQNISDGVIRHIAYNLGREPFSDVFPDQACARCLIIILIAVVSHYL